MEKQIIAKTLLRIWPELLAEEELLANKVYTQALCSFQATGHAEQLIQKIIDLNVRQHTLHNLRLSLDQVINQMPATTQAVVRSYYRGGEHHPKTKVLAARLGLAERTYFRQLHNATQYLANKLTHLGINFFTWQYLLRQHAWLRAAFTRECQPKPGKKPTR